MSNVNIDVNTDNYNIGILCLAHHVLKLSSCSQRPTVKPQATAKHTYIIDFRWVADYLARLIHTVESAQAN